MFKFTRRKSILFLVIVSGLLISYSFGTFANYVDAATVAAPVFSPGSKSLTTKTKISLSSATSGATIYYTYSRSGTPSNPTTSSYKYSSSKGIDLQQSSQFYVGTYKVKAVAYLNGTYSSVTSATYTVTNKDQSYRNTLSGKSISVNKDDCWLADKKICTSLVGMKSATLNEIGYFAAGCKSWMKGTSANSCGVLVTGGTEAGHASGSCSHSGGYKFDMTPYTSSSNITKYIKTSGQFTPMANRSDGAAQYKWKSGGAVYALESNHWDVAVGCSL